VQTVELVTLIQDAVFYIQNDLLMMELQKVYQLVKKNLWFYLDEMIQLTETNCISQKQTLRNIWLRRSSSNKTAIFDAGSRVYFHANSGLLTISSLHGEYFN
jgi:hypothetical protein